MKESLLQMQVVRYLKAQLPPDSVIHHSPNEGNRKPQYGRKLKLMGVKAGYPDIEVAVPLTYFPKNKRPAMLFIELKSDKGRLRKNQQEVLEKLSLCGHYCCVAYSLQDVVDFIKGIFDDN